MDMKEATIAETPDFRELARLLVDAARASADASRVPGHPPGDRAEDVEAVTLRLEELPKELGVLLTSVGVLGFVLPGIAGAPALIAGGLVLWPKTFGKVEGWFSRRYPVAHRASMKQVGRFLTDLARRYPQSESTES